MTAEDQHDEGRGFLRDMETQSARAHDFDRRLRWSRLRKRLRAEDEVTGHAADSSDEVEPAGEVVDLRDDPATSSAAPEVPRPRPRRDR